MTRFRSLFLAVALPLLAACAAPSYAENDGYYYGGNYNNGSGYSYGNSGYGYGNGYGNGQVFYPEEGIACDRKLLFCYAEDGLHTRATKRYFGEEAARRAEENWDRYGDIGYGNGGRIFSPRSGVLCDRQVEICVTPSGGIDVSRTGKVFGDDARRNARNWVRSAQFSPERRVVCDNSRRACFDRRRPNLQLTEFYFGRRAARDLAWQMGQRY